MKLMCLGTIAVLLLCAVAAWSAEPNLIRRGGVFSGSDFEAEPQGWRLETKHYFPMAADGDQNTFWRAAAKRGPHYLDIRWRTPVRINKIAWHGRKFGRAQFSIWQAGAFRPVAELNGASGESSFSEVTAPRVRFEMLDATDIPELAELVLEGPEQWLPPAQLPDSTRPDNTVTLTGFSPLPPICKPGDRIEFHFDVQVTGYSEPIVLLFELKERTEMNNLRYSFGDINIAAAHTAVIAPNHSPAQGKITLELPPWMPAGDSTFTVTALTGDGRQRLKLTGDTPPTVRVERPEAKLVYAKQTPAAAIGDINGWRGFQVGNELLPPFFNHFCTTIDFERFYGTRLNHSRIQNVQLYPTMLFPRPSWPQVFARLNQEVNAILRVRPDALFLVGVDLRASENWKKQHPDAMMLDAAGNLLLDNKRPVVSYGSPELLRDSLDFFAELIAFVNQQPWHSRVIGYQPWSNTKNDAFIGGISCNQGVGDRSRLRLGDFNPGAIAEFQKFLREKYRHNVEALRQAWNQPEIDFEHALPPGAMLGAEDFKRGFFRDPVASRPAIDYWEFFPTMIGNYHRRIGALIKEKTNNKALVFIHYGAVINNLTTPMPTGNRIHSSNYDLAAMLRDPNIDMYVQAMPYDQRHAGKPIVIYQPTSSIALHRRMYLVDYDIRTIAAGTLNFGRHRSLHETEALIRRDLAWMLTRQSGAWFADMSTGGAHEFKESQISWIGAPEAAKPTGSMLNLFSDEVKSGATRRTAAEMAFIFSLNSPRYEDLLNSAVGYYNLIDRMFYREVTKLGAPYDVYLSDDLTHPDFPEYKMYCFVNLFYATATERQAIEKLKKAGKTLIFLYAPGYVTDRGFDVEAASRLCGIQLAVDTAHPSAMKLTLSDNAQNPLLKNGVAASVLNGGGWSGAEPMYPERVSPTFEVVDPHATVLGRTPDGKAALAVKKVNGAQVVYSAVPYLSRDFLRNIAVAAGVHFYCSDDGVTMAADSRLLMFHNGCDVPRTITVTPPPGVKQITDAFSAETLSRGEPFPLSLKAPETRILLMTR